MLLLTVRLICLCLLFSCVHVSVLLLLARVLQVVALPLSGDGCGHAAMPCYIFIVACGFGLGEGWRESSFLLVYVLVA